MKNSKTISNWLNSGEYRSQIDHVLTKIIRNCENAKNESQTSTFFENEIGYLFRSQLGLELSFNKEKVGDFLLWSSD